jgi:hypothetical protein
MDLAGELQNTLCGGGFAGIHVSEDANVSIVRQIGHGFV